MWSDVSFAETWLVGPDGLYTRLTALCHMLFHDCFSDSAFATVFHFSENSYSKAKEKPWNLKIKVKLKLILWTGKTFLRNHVL